MRLKQDSADGSLVVPSSMSRNIAQWAEKFSEAITEKGKSNYNIKSFTTQHDSLTCVYYTSDDLHLSQELDQCGSASSDISPAGEEDSGSASVTSDSDSDEGNLLPTRRGIINPNYPGFQDLVDELNSDEETSSVVDNNNSNNNNNNTVTTSTATTTTTTSTNITTTNTNNNIISNINNNNSNCNNNNNNNNLQNFCNIDSVNQLESVNHKTFYDTPKFNLTLDSITSDLTNINLKTFDSQTVQSVKDLNILDSTDNDKSNLDNTEVKCVNDRINYKSDCVEVSDMAANIVAFDLLKENKMADAFLSGVKDEIKQCEDTNRTAEILYDKLTKEDEDKEVNDKEKEDDPVIPRKKEKMEINYHVKKGWVQTQPQNLTVNYRPRADVPSRSSLANRRSIPSMREKKKMSPEVMGGFDVYNIETAMPHIDLDAIESHLRAAREEERRVSVKNHLT